MLGLRTVLSLERSQREKQQGDTIVEVLIATAIISLVLVMAYATATRNARSSQETREQTQAVKIAERQLELLRSSSVGETDMPDATNPCYPAGGVDPGTACTFTADGSGAEYTVAITKDAASGVYSVSVKWDALSGQTPNVTMRYIP